MKKNYTSIWRLLSRCFLLLLLCCSMLHFNSSAQTNLGTTTTFSNDTSASLVTFNFQNTNSYPVMITNVAGVLSSFGIYSAELWYKTTAINGLPGDISTANGWTMATSSASISGIANTGNTTTQPLFNGLSLSIPANTTYGFAVFTNGPAGAGQRIDTLISTTTLSAGGCNILTGANIGFAGWGTSPVTPTAAGRGWIGTITFINGSNCTGTPSVPVISGPANICSGSLFTLSATGYSMGAGINYQWQYYNTASSTWVDITGATSPGYVAAAGITASTQYRLRTSCSFSSTQSYSNTLTVGIGAALPGGIYTINNNQPSSPTNFTSFTAAAAAMSCGIAGAVTLNVDPASGPYTEAVIFNKISGTSASNKIRLNGNGAILQYSTVADTTVILNIRGTSFMTVDSLTIRSLVHDNIYSGGILLSDTTRYDSITHCRVDMSSISQTNTASYGIGFAGAYFYGNSDSSTASYCYIGYNHVLGSDNEAGPYYGIVSGNGWFNAYYGSDTMNIIAHNEIENTLYFGIYCFGSNSLKILYNNIHRTNKQINEWSNFTGIQYDGGGAYGNQQNYQQNTEIVGNRIHDIYNQATINPNGASFCGIYSYTWDYNNNVSEGGKTIIANNAIYNIHNALGSVAGIAYYNDYYFNTNGQNDTIYICHNTIDLSDVITSGNANTYGLYTTYYDQQNNYDAAYVWNNMVTVTGGSGGSKFGFGHTNFNNITSDVDAQRNNIYVNTPLSAAQYYATKLNVNYPTLTAYQAAYPTQEVGSLSLNPQYLNPAAGDFTPTNMALLGNGLNMQSLVPYDINGKGRPSNPTPGAFELAADGAVTALASPLGTYCSSVRQVSVVIANTGLLTLNTLQLNWTLNGVLQPVVNYTGALPGINSAPNNTATVTLGNGLFLPNTPVEIKVWCSLPNGLTDGNHSNDTLVAISQSSSSLTVDLGNDDSICTGNTRTLDAGFTGSSYMWDNLAITQTRTISAAGTYYVRVTANNGCIGVDTYHLALRPLPVVDLGPDREICLGETTTFDAGHPGASYLWDDGSTAQTRTVDTAGYYEVSVTDEHGCTGVDDISVFMKDIPSVDGINATHADSGTYTFYPINPLYAFSYKWNFGDGSPEATGYFVQHTYTALGIYTVTLSLVGECTGLVITNSRTVDVFSIRGGGGTGIDNTYNSGDFSIAPNPAKEQVTIFNHTNEKMRRLVVYNILGQVIIDQPADSAVKHSIHTGAMANGVYTIRIETNKGTVIRKFEVMN